MSDRATGPGEVRRLADDTDHAETVALLARAFWDDPLFDFLAGGDLLAEYRVLPHVFRSALQDLRAATAECYVMSVSGRRRCFAGWLGPGTFPRSRRDRLVRDGRAIMLLLRLRHRRAAAALLGEVERRHPTEAHW